MLIVSYVFLVVIHLVGWLLELLEGAFGKDERLTKIRGYVEDSGEGRWTVQQAVESGVSASGIALSLFRHFI